MEYLNRSELAKLFRVIHAGNEIHLLACLTAFWTGARVSQVLALEGQDIFEADGKLVIHSSVSNLLPFPSSSSSSSSATPQATVSASGVQTHTEPPEPGAIDNWAILRKTGAKQLLQGTMLGQHVETVPPSVYAAVRSWYSGGPRILRKVRSFVWFINARLLTGRCIVIIVLQPAIVRASSTKKRCYLL